jgi:hypothetical protein
MRFICKDANFNNIINLSDFEQLDKQLIIEIVRLKQAPKKISQIEQLSDTVVENSNAS